MKDIKIKSIMPTHEAFPEVGEIYKAFFGKEPEPSPGDFIIFFEEPILNAADAEIEIKVQE
jgi:hypothetical protein